MKSINKKTSKTSQSLFEVITNSKHSTWNNRRRYSNVNQFRFI